MGKRIIKPNDPERLARIMDERTRMIGIDAHHLDVQAEAKRRAEEAAARQKQAEDQQQAKLDAELQRRRALAEEEKKKVAARVAERVRQQIAEKEQKDAAAREMYSNRVEPEYFAQFGTSHR